MSKPEIDSYWLYPCPCCSGKAMWVTAIGPRGYVYWVKCEECHLATPPRDTKEEAQDIWNLRKGSKPPKKEKKIEQSELPF